METLKSLKIGQEIEITFEQASNYLRASEYKLEFLFISGNKESVKNKSYAVRKTGRKGSVTIEGKAQMGVFEVILTWDYVHPTNFCQNKSGNTRKFQFVF